MPRVKQVTAWVESRPGVLGEVAAAMGADLSVGVNDSGAREGVGEFALNQVSTRIACPHVPPGVRPVAADSNCHRDQCRDDDDVFHASATSLAPMFGVPPKMNLHGSASPPPT